MYSVWARWLNGMLECLGDSCQGDCAHSAILKIESEKLERSEKWNRISNHWNELTQSLFRELETKLDLDIGMACVKLCQKTLKPNSFNIQTSPDPMRHRFWRCAFNFLSGLNWSVYLSMHGVYQGTGTLAQNWNAFSFFIFFNSVKMLCLIVHDYK